MGLCLRRLISNARSAPPKLTVSGFVGIQKPQGGCTACGEGVPQGVVVAGPVQLQQQQQQQLNGEMHELKVLTLVRKGAASMDRFYGPPRSSGDSGGYTYSSLAKGFQSI